MINLMQGDCLELMKTIPDGSVDMVLTDPPYGTTACKWDSIIPFEPMWDQLKRVTKKKGAIVMTASQPFTSALVMSNPKMFKYCWVWDKVNKYTGSLHSNKRRLTRHEDVLVFYQSLPPYNKQWRDGASYRTVKTKGHGNHWANPNDYSDKRVYENRGKHNPCSILPIPADNKKELGRHPTQKPIALMEYFIKTYTNEGETVLDFTMGSGTTGVACKNLNRDFIGIELDEEYFKIAEERIANA